MLICICIWCLFTFVPKHTQCEISSPIGTLVHAILLLTNGLKSILRARKVSMLDLQMTIRHCHREDWKLKSTYIFEFLAFNTVYSWLVNQPVSSSVGIFSLFFTLMIPSLVQLWKRFRGNDKPPAHLGPSRDYNVDMIPKVRITYFLGFIRRPFF